MDMDTNAETIWDFFGLTYASYLVLPRVVMQGMPEEWQKRFVGMMKELEETMGTDHEPEGGYRVLPLDIKKRVTKSNLPHYRHGRVEPKKQTAESSQ